MPASQLQLDKLLAHEDELKEFVVSPAGRALLAHLKDGVREIQRQILDGSSEQFDRLTGWWQGFDYVVKLLQDAEQGFPKTKPVKRAIDSDDLDRL